MAKTDSIIDGLTQKQALFVSEYLKNGGNATQAYLKAGYKAKDEKVACTAGTRLLRNVRISRAIAERQKKLSDRLELEEDFEIKRAIRILDMCMEPKRVYNMDGTPKEDENGNGVFCFDSKGANGALTIIAKIRGKFVEKRQIDVNVTDRSSWLNDVLKDMKDE